MFCWNAKRKRASTRAKKGPVHQGLRYPLFVKPNGLGSSKGVNPAPDEDQLFLALGAAAEVDERLIVEEAVEEPTEITSPSWDGATTCAVGLRAAEGR